MSNHQSNAAKVNKAIIASAITCSTMTTIAFFAPAYFNYRDRLATLESRAIASSWWQINPAAVIVSKDMGFFSRGYKITVKDNDRQFDLYASPEEYLAAQPGQKTCVRYKLLNSKVKAAHLCQSITGEK